MKKFFLFLVLCCILVAGVYADKCTILEEQGHSYLVFTSQNPSQVSAYTVQMNTSDPSTRIVEMLDVFPFSVFANIDPVAGNAKVSGFVGNPGDIPPPSTVIKLAEILYSGDSSKIEISVLDLEGADRKQMSVENAVATLSPQVTPTLPIYNSNPPQSPPPGTEPVVIHVTLSGVNAQGTIPLQTGAQLIPYQSPVQGSQISSQNNNASENVMVSTSSVNDVITPQNPDSAGSPAPVGVNSPSSGKSLPSSPFIIFLSVIVVSIAAIIFRQ